MRRVNASSLRRPWYVVLSIAAGSAIALSSCGGGRAELGPGVTPCYQALPLAQKESLKPSFFIGVKLVTGKTASKILSTNLPSTETSVCIVAYKLHHGKASADQPGPRFDLIAVSAKSKKLLASKELRKLPIDFRRNAGL